MDTPGNPHGKQSKPDSGKGHDFSPSQNLDLNVQDMRLGGPLEERREMQGRKRKTNTWAWRDASVVKDTAASAVAIIPGVAYSSL